MRKFKNKCLGGAAAMAILACANLAQAGTPDGVAPKVMLHHQQISGSQVDIELGVADLGDEVAALEVSFVADDIKEILGYTSKLAGSYITCSLQQQADGKEKLSLYIVSQEQQAPLAAADGKLAACSLQTGGRLNVEKDQISVKVIETGYVTKAYEQAELIYTEGNYKPAEDGNNQNAGNAGEGSMGNNEGAGSNAGGNIGGSAGGNTSSSDDDDVSSGGGAAGSTSHESANNNAEAETSENSKVPDTSSVSFTDLESHWAKAAIMNMAGQGIIKGYADGSFKPGASITRGEFATLLARAFKLEKAGSTNPFKDVAAGKWYADGITALYEAGITSGRPDGSFGVNAPITNEEISAMLYRTLTVLNMNLSEINPSGIQFKDNEKISTYAKEAVQSLVKMGIISGQPDGSFGPKNSTSRAQVAVMLDRIFHSVK